MISSEKIEAKQRKEKKKMIKAQPPSFMSLPEEIIEIILARVSRWNYPKLSLVSKSFHSLLSSMDIYKRRSEMGTTETFLYICLQSISDQSNHWFILQARPNRTKTKEFRENSEGNVLVPITPPSPDDFLPVPYGSTIAVGSEIYVIGGTYIGRSYKRKPSSSVRVLDCRKHIWRSAPNMKVARNEADAVSLGEKIYVTDYGEYGTNQSAHYLEVFDLKTQSWTAFPGPCENPGAAEISTVVQGKLHVMTLTKDYFYDPKQGTWKVVREASNSIHFRIRVVVDNVMCCCTYEGNCMWYDIESGKCEMIKGLEILREHPQHGLSTESVHALLNYGGNLLVIWEPKESHTCSKIWYAEISLEKRCNGREIWGNIEWVDVMFTLPRNLYDEILHCSNVSV